MNKTEKNMLIIIGKIARSTDLQFFNLFFKIGFVFLFDIGISGILYLQMQSMV